MIALIMNVGARRPLLVVGSSRSITCMSIRDESSMLRDGLHVNLSRQLLEVVLESLIVVCQHTPSDSCATHALPHP